MLEFSFENWNKFIDFIRENLPNNEVKSFNLNDLSEKLGLTKSELKFLFTIFIYACDYSNKYLNKINIKILKDTIYFTYSENHIKKISLSIKDYKDLSDIIYLFKNIQKGRGFEINSNSNIPVITKIQGLYRQYPFMFKKLNGYIFPSEIGYKLGIAALSFKRINQIPKTLDVLNYKFKIKKKEFN